MYCFDCGKQLIEYGIGFLKCKRCDSTFLPINDSGQQTLVQILKGNKSGEQE